MKKAIGFFLILGLAGMAVAEKPENVALKATVTATAEFNDQYLARFVVDGIIPEPGKRDGNGEEWAVKGSKHPNGVELTMRWHSPVDLFEIVYYSRSSFAVEGFKDCEVYLDDAKKPVAKGTFAQGHGPQRLNLPERTKASKLTLKFLNAHPCGNPGAAEIEVYSRSPTKKQLGGFVAMDTLNAKKNAATVRDLKEAPELAEKLYAGELGFRQLLMVQRHAYNISHVYTYHVESFTPGGGIYICTPDRDGGKLEKIFDAAGGEVMDCSLSCDGKEILFSYKKKPTIHEIAKADRKHHLNHMITDRDAKYQVFRMNLANRKPILLTDHHSNNFNPCWLPDGRIAFLSDRKLSFAYCFTSSSPLLYRMDRDGSNIFKLSHGYLNDFTPSVLNDGRIIYSRWEYVDRPAIPIQSLWTLRPDGTKSEGFFGNRVLEPGTFMGARSIGNTRNVICVMTGHNGGCRGALGVINPDFGANAQEGIRNITPEIPLKPANTGNGNGLVNKGHYENPFPIDEKYFLVSKLGTAILRDYDGTGRVTIAKPADGMGFYSPIPIRAIKPPPVRPSMLPEGDVEPWGSVVMQDVYNGLEPDVKRGEIVRIAVVEEVEKGDYAPHMGIYGFQFPLVSCGATYAAKKLWGYADVEKDGSAHFKVPAELPFYFLALDKEGRAVQKMRSLTHFQRGERQSCIGCHADRNYATPVNRIRRPIAALRAPQELDVPEWGRRKFSYSTIVQPVLDEYCIKCHNARKQPKGIDLTGDKTDFWNVSYEYLARKGTHGEKDPFRHGVKNLEEAGRNPYVKWTSTINGAEANILMIKPRTWGSPASKLTEIIMSGHPDKKGEKRFTMDDQSMRRIFAWMDLNVPYYRDSKTNHPDQPGSRMMRPPELEKVLADVGKRRCAECHDNIPRKFYTRITNIEENQFLSAPLAKAAGGTEACGQATFASKNDPDYVAILKTFEPVTELMQERPRIDFPNAEYVPHEHAHPKLTSCQPALSETPDRRPNILFAISDDQSWPHASAYGCQFVKTPAFDRVASAGVLFHNAFAPAPQCSPCRGAILTGRNPWQNGDAAVHGTPLPPNLPIYTDLLKQAGYHVGMTGKGWAPGPVDGDNPAGKNYSCKGKPKYTGAFRAFLKERRRNQPFCFWYGSREPHRGYKKGSGLKAGKTLESVDVPDFMPDTDAIRSDFLDYAIEIELFDTHLGHMLDIIEEMGELDNTLVVVTSDNGMQWARAKANIYEHGVHMPLAIQWKDQIPPHRNIDDLVSLIDFAPSFLEAAGLPASPCMAGKSLLGMLKSQKNGRIDVDRNHVVFGRERHTPFVRENDVGYPSRAIRTHDYLYIRNFKPERWPEGDTFYCGGDSSARALYIEQCENPEIQPYLKLAWAKRPAEELFDIKADPCCINNIAADARYAKPLDELSGKLNAILRKQSDPRIAGDDHYDDVAYFTDKWQQNRPTMLKQVEQVHRVMEARGWD